MEARFSTFKTRLFLVLVACAMLIAQAWSTISVVQNKTNAANVASPNFSMTSTPTNGNFLLVYVSTSATSAPPTVSSISETGVTWTSVKVHSDAGDGNAAADGEWWIGYPISGASSSITVNLSHSARSSITVLEVSGITNTATDQTAQDDYTTELTTTSAKSGTTATTTAASEIWVAGFAIAHQAGGNTVSSYAASSGWTNIAGANSGTGVQGGVIAEVDYKIVSATGTASDIPSWTGAQDAWSGIAATFGTAATGGSSAPAIIIVND